MWQVFAGSGAACDVILVSQQKNICGDSENGLILFLNATNFVNNVYKECILPDIKSGAMGRIWLYSGSQDYLSKVYALNIEIDIYDSTKESNYDQALNDGKSSAVAADDQYFSTTLTADAVNTLKWIKDNTGIVPVMEKDSGMDVGKTEAAVNGGTYYEG